MRPLPPEPKNASLVPIWTEMKHCISRGCLAQHFRTHREGLEIWISIEGDGEAAELLQYGLDALEEERKKEGDSK